MLEKIAKYIPFTTLIVIYFYLCGCLYLVSYWSTFNIEISNFVQLTEIPKSFVQPFIIANAFFLFSFTSQLVTSKKEKSVPNKRPIPHKRWHIIFDPTFYILIGGFIVPFIIIDSKSITLWVVCGAILGFSLAEKLNTSDLGKSAIANPSLRRYITTILVVTPFFCIAGGKARSLRVYKNIDIKYISIDPKINSIAISTACENQRLKLLGFLGDKFIMGTLDNKKQYIVNQSAGDLIELENKAEE